MQSTLPYESWRLPNLRPSPPFNRPPDSTNQFTGSIAKKTGAPAKSRLRDAVSENAVVVFARRGCCMSHVVKRLLNSHGVNPAVFEVEENDENDVVEELQLIGDDGKDERRVQFPAVFIGGRLFGGLDRVMATHITGELIPVLKQAGALWL